jgi:hypothetical protein
MSKFICTICGQRKFNQLRSYILHLRIRHAQDANFRAVCGISECKSEYDKFPSLYRHIYRHHNELIESSSNEHHHNTDQSDDLQHSASDDDGVDDDNVHDRIVNVDRLAVELNKFILKFSLKLREQFLIPASTHSNIMDDCSSLLSSVLTCEQQVIINHLKGKGYDISEDKELQALLNPDKYERTLKDCSSTYMLTSQCSKQLGMIAPKPHTSGNYKGYYVPITNILKKLVQMEDITPFVINSKLSDKDYMTGYTGGDAFKLLPNFEDGANRLLIHLYNDEFEVCNPIGSKRGKHKINAVYFTLGNLPIRYRSKLQHIYLVNIAKHKDVKAEGYAVAFAPLIQELKQLYTEGFSVTMSNGCVEKFYAVLCTISGDNLSSNALAGFRQAFNSGRFCRMCMISHSELADKLSEDSVTLRTFQNHTYHVNEVKNNPANSAIYGVNGPCVFSDLEYLDVTSTFPPDIMHDVMEGVIPIISKTIIKRLVTAKIVTVVELNKNLCEFQFQGADRTNKPEPIKPDCEIIGSATQKMSFFRFIPFIVPLQKCSEVKKLYKLTHEVIMFAFSRCVARQDLDYFDQIIEGLRCFVKDKFPELHITPKFHFIIHYPTMMARYGPLREHWCMRYEAKHQYFKSIASSLGNFINVAKTLASRHQMLQCYWFSENEALGHEFTLARSGKSVALSSLSVDLQEMLCYAKSDVWSVKEATVRGCTYSIGAAIVIDFTSDGDPVFIHVKHLFVPHDGHLDIIGRLLTTVKFSNVYYAFQVADNGWAHCHAEIVKDPALVWPYVVESETYISLPYHIPTWSHNLNY